LSEPSGKRGKISVAVQTLGDGVRAAVSRERMAAAGELVMRAEGAGAGLLSITLLSKPRMAAFNRKHLGHAGATAGQR